jgi:chromosome segregation protein
LAIAAQREAAQRARQALDDAGRRVAECEAEYGRALVAVQSAEREADEMRASVLAATTTLSALRQARDHAAAVRDRVAAERERLDAEERDLRADADRARLDREAAVVSLAGARDRLEAVRLARTAAELDVAERRGSRDALAQALVAGQQELAELDARLRSLEQLEASRATFGDGARFLLGEAAGALGRHGAVADHFDVDRSFERAVDALLGDLLQHVVVDHAGDLTTALALASAQNAGRCGLVVLDDIAAQPAFVPAAEVPAGARALGTVARATGPHAHVLSRLIGEALIVEDLGTAQALARVTGRPVATMSGEVVRGAGVVEGGSRRDARGIFETRGEILVLREQVAARGAANATLSSRAADADEAIVAGDAMVAGYVAGHHNEEKAIVGIEAQLARAEEEFTRLSRRLDVVVTECRRASDEEATAEGRREEAAAAITMHETRQRGAEHRLGDVMASLQSARGDAEARTRQLTEARAGQAGLMERTSALDSEAIRLDEAARELEERIGARRAEIDRHAARRGELQQSIRETERRLDEGVRQLDLVKLQVRSLDERVSELRVDFSAREHGIRTARHAFEGVRSQVLQSEVARATAVGDLAHLASACQDAVSASLDEVVAAVTRMEADGELVAPAARLAAALTPDDDEEGEGVEPVVAASTGTILSPDDVIADLRRKIERLGPVNMMAIEQFDELETRHTFLTTQRKDLLDSIAQTGEAIRKIDTTTRERFAEAFEVINRHFETTFMTLFGGGRAGLVLIDQENDPESGIDIIAQPPGKRLQNVQLLSGGEKALTAMALMFAIFKHRPSPFCLLDEIDAPLDDANIGRFVEMLVGMQAHTQFILITHNRKTMEIADRLYGVTMEEPGVSKLISVQLN